MRFMYEESLEPICNKVEGVIKPGSRATLYTKSGFRRDNLDIAGCDIPDEMQGVSFKPVLLSGKTSENWRKSLYYHYYEWPAIHMVMRHDGVIMGKEKLIDFYPIGEREYYDLSTDPNELNNLAGDPSAERRSRSKELRRLSFTKFKVR
ncbi:MAG: sulfatase/phosphatase domain-containing protein [Bacilli bacterium]